jgi:hypothetical protein
MFGAARNVAAGWMDHRCRRRSLPARGPHLRPDALGGVDKRLSRHLDCTAIRPIQVGDRLNQPEPP